MSGSPSQTMPSRPTRVLRGVASSAFSLATRVGVQMAQVPILLSVWGVERYGEWLLLATLPVYLSLSGGGVSTVASNMVASAVAAGDTEKARNVFQAAWRLVTISNVVIVVLAAGVLSSPYVASLVRFRTITQGDAIATIFLLVLLVVLRLQSAVLAETTFRARGRYAEAQALETFCQIGEFLMLAGCVFLFEGTAAVAAGLVAVRLMLLVGLLVRLGTSDRWLLRPPQQPRSSAIRELLRPSLSLLLFPLAQAVQFEGVMLAIGYLLGPIAVALYISLRTFARVVDTMLIMAYNIMLAEAAYMFGKGERDKLRILLGVGSVLSVMAAVAIIAAARVGGGVLFQEWTAGKIEFDVGLFYIVVGIALVRSAYMPAAAILVGSNKHSPLGVVHVSAALLSLLCAYIFGLFTENLSIMVGCTWIGEIILAATSLKMAAVQLGMTRANWIRLPVSGWNECWDMMHRAVSK